MLKQPTVLKEIRLSYFTKNDKEDELLDYLEQSMAASDHDKSVDDKSARSNNKPRKNKNKKKKNDSSFASISLLPKDQEENLSEMSPKFGHEIHWSNEIKTEVNWRKEPDLWQIIRLQAL